MELPEHEVHVWYVLLDDESLDLLLEGCLALLSEDERAQAQRFVFAHLSRQYAIAHALVRTTLSRYAPVPAAAWRFCRNQYGCPAIAGEQALTLVEAQALRFNLSHTDGLVACAVTRGREVGIDVERVTRTGGGLDVADRFFSPREAQALRVLPASRQRQRFFEYWTLKESYIKARGMGLALPLHSFSFTLAESGQIDIDIDAALGDDPASWQFALLAPTREHLMAIAARRRKDPELRLVVSRTLPLASPNE